MNLLETLQVYVVFHNLEPPIQSLWMFKGVYIKKDQREFLCAKILKISIVIKNVIWSEKTLTHNAERPRNDFIPIFHISSG